VTEPVFISAENPGALTGRGNNTWLLPGREPALIDAGVGAPGHIRAIEAALAGQSLRRVLVTHGHADHASGMPALRARWPDVEACKWPSTDDRGGWTPLSEAQRVQAGDATLEVIHTPGHALDHVCFWDRTRRRLFAGDMLLRGTTVMIPAGRGGGLRAYMASLERLAALEPARIYPGHGPIIDDPLPLIAEYLEHRRLRDRQVAACLADGLTNLDAIVDRIYPELAAPLRAAARATVEAHIEKLRGDAL
jgi:glyoxylase-like metal-dependent hydrolase (beta-lactamase superfamily II)